MDILNSVEVIVLVALGLVIGMIALLILQTRNSKKISNLTPAYEYTIQKAQKEADEIIGAARKQAREIVTSAEVQSEQTIASRKTEVEQYYESFLRSLSEMKEVFSSQMHSSVNQIQARSDELARLFSASLETQESDMKAKLTTATETLAGIPDRLVAESSSASRELQERIARAGEDLEKAFGNMQEENKKQITEHLMKKFAEAEADIDAYRQSRNSLIDKHLEVLVKDVVRITLEKELTANDHAALVRRALEKAGEVNAI